MASSPQTLAALQATGTARDTSLDKMLAAYHQGAGGRMFAAQQGAEEMTAERIAAVMDADRQHEIAEKNKAWIQKENARRVKEQAIAQSVIDASGAVGAAAIATSKSLRDKGAEVPKRKTARQIAQEDIAEVEAINKESAYQRALEAQPAGLSDAPPGEILSIPGTSIPVSYGGGLSELRGGGGRLTGRHTQEPLQINLAESARRARLEQATATTPLERIRAKAQDRIAEHAARRAGRVVGHVEPEWRSQEELGQLAADVEKTASPTWTEGDQQAKVEQLVAKAVAEAKARGEGDAAQADIERAVRRAGKAHLSAARVAGVTGEESRSVVQNPSGGDPYEYTKMDGVWLTRKRGSSENFTPVDQTNPALLQLLDSWLEGGQ